MRLTCMLAVSVTYALILGRLYPAYPDIIFFFYVSAFRSHIEGVFVSFFFGFRPSPHGIRIFLKAEKFISVFPKKKN